MAQWFGCCWHNGGWYIHRNGRDITKSDCGLNTPMKKELITFAILGALLSRWHGGGFFKASKTLKNICFAILPTYVLSLIIPNDNVWTYSGWLVLCFAGVLGGKAMAHGQWFSLGYIWKKIVAEKFDFIVSALFGDDPRVLGLEYDKKYYPWLYWRCVFGMALKGLLMSLGVAIPLLVYEPALSVPVILGGIMLAPSYMIGRLFTEKYATEFGEYVGGFFFYLGVYISLTNA